MPRKKKTEETEVMEEVVSTEEMVAEAANAIAKDDEGSEDIPADWKPILDLYDQYVTETDDMDAIRRVCQTANQLVYERFGIHLDHPSDPARYGFKMTAVIFIVIYKSAIRKIRDMRQTHDTFSINVANRFKLGYDNNFSTEDEKTGNIMCYLQDLGYQNMDSAKDTVEFLSDDRSREHITAWNQENIIENPIFMQEIAAMAKRQLDNINIKMGNAEYIFPIFATIYDALITYMSITRRERDLDDYEINFLNCFSIIVRDQNTGVDQIILRPSIEEKSGTTGFKSDDIATRKYD